MSNLTTSVSNDLFHLLFEMKGRGDSFSEQGLDLLYGHMRNATPVYKQSVNIDVIELCGLYTESELDYTIDYHDIIINEGDDKVQTVKDYLARNTYFIGCFETNNETHFIYAAF